MRKKELNQLFFCGNVHNGIPLSRMIRSKHLCQTMRRT